MQVGVVGLGYWGSKHVRVLSSLSDVDRVVCFDLDRQRQDVIAAAFPAAAVAPSLADLLDVVDAVVLATHPSTHAALAEAALEAGVHVLVEKPLALTSREGADLVDLAAARGLTLMVGHTFAYNPAVRALRDLVQRGDLGDVWHIDSQRLNLGLYQSDCDVVWDLAPHDVSIINTLVGTAPTVVRAWGRGHLNRSIADNAYVMLEYAGLDVQAVVHVSWLDPHKVRRLTVVGSQRMAVYDDLADDERIRIYDKGVVPGEDFSPSTPMTYRYGDIHSPYIPFSEPLRLEDQHFVDSVRDGTRPLTDGEAGLEVVRTLEAASTSLREGRAVSLAEVGDTARVLR
ncbi:Gfo/Idh/MocA family protein [Kineococcus esterisolvens]|uniref:Gfo/Idh/MocA family protein n=1 Tax=unclassified Kineococcus TaxID=2621656 RepID=UPI003D7DCFD7